MEGQVDIDKLAEFPLGWGTVGLRGAVAGGSRRAMEGQVSLEICGQPRKEGSWDPLSADGTSGRDGTSGDTPWDSAGSCVLPGHVYWQARDECQVCGYIIDSR